MTKVCVIGAGLSGLATAWYLTEANVPVHVVEASVRPGGLIWTEREPEGLVEAAANAFARTARVEQLFRALGITPALAQPVGRRRYIFRQGRPRRWPLTAAESLGAASRLTLAWLRGRAQPAEGESVAEWAERVAGRQAAALVIDPAMRGVYAAPAASLSAAAVLGQRRRSPAGVVAPVNGMREVIQGLQLALERRGVTFEWNRRVHVLDSRVWTVLAVDASSAAMLLRPYAPQLAAAISTIQSRSLLTVTAFYPASASDVHGFGVLFPRDEGVRALGVLFNADVFAGRSSMRSETWIYDDPTLEPVLPDVLQRDRHTLTGRHEAPVARYGAARPNAIPVYGKAVLDARAALHTLPRWLAVTGNYLGRLGVAKLLEAAADTATQMANQIRTGSPRSIESGTVST